MRLGCTIVYVPDVAASPGIFEAAFGLSTRFLHESGAYGELETGAHHAGIRRPRAGRRAFRRRPCAASTCARPLGMEIALVTDDVAAARTRPGPRAPRAGHP